MDGDGGAHRPREQAARDVLTGSEHVAEGLQALVRSAPEYLTAVCASRDDKARPVTVSI